MENTYLFIIWSKTLWARTRIVEDLTKNFDIVLNVFVKWDKEKFEDNLKAFYGNKIDDVKAKIKITGYGPFNVLVIKDNKPMYEKRKVHSKEEIVNRNIFDKKELYRKWTGRNFRIHSSIDTKETMHDLTVLFGHEYKEMLGNTKDNIILETNTKGVSGFRSKEDLMNCLLSFGNNSVFFNKEFIVFANNRLDIERFIVPKKQERCRYEVEINNNFEKIFIFGIQENDLSNSFDNSLINDANFIRDFNIVIYNHCEFLKNKNNMAKELLQFYKKYNLDYNLEEVNTLRNNPRQSLFEKIKYSIKYIIARINNVFYLKERL